MATIEVVSRLALARDLYHVARHGYRLNLRPAPVSALQGFRDRFVAYALTPSAIQPALPPNRSDAFVRNRRSVSCFAAMLRFRISSAVRKPMRYCASFGGERLGVDLEDVSDCVAMSPLQKCRDPNGGSQPAGPRCVYQHHNASHRSIAHPGQTCRASPSFENASEGALHAVA